MLTISRFFYQKTNLVICILSTVIMVLYAALVMGTHTKIVSAQVPEDAGLLGLQVGYSYEFVLRLFKALDHAALSEYMQLLTVWDIFFPFIYGSMYLFWLSWLYRNFQFKTKWFRLINLFPIVSMLADFFENYVEYGLVNNFVVNGVVEKTDVTIASAVTTIKWSISLMNYGVLLLGVFILTYQKLKRE